MRTSTDPSAATAERYRQFAAVEATGLSACYEEWARGVAGDPAAVALIDHLPPAKRQPNLVFTSARFLGAPVSPYPAFADWLGEHWHEVEGVALTHATQTNEAGRCAVLLPALAALAGQVRAGGAPLALIEVGASAGLCLHPDRYSYRYATPTGERMLHPVGGPSPVVLDCMVTGPAPIPERMPAVIWRAGIDLNPLSVTRQADVDWLDALIWPEHDDRRARLRAAVAVARRHPAEIVQGDLNEQVGALVGRARAETPAGTMIVVFHTAVLLYLDPEAQARFAAHMRRLPVRWLSNEAQGVVPGVLEKLVRVPAVSSDFVLALDGDPIAFTQPHGRSIRWF
ncbi:DUF2332 domain-containing protein [Cryobacterium melibiosiphilum]|uniref:DUF2332 domain-containing protein n=1 Tax=Cryobacterium melibiosiphilum TaxID=995039 RepID=A0A3A5MDD5_9MICO|nr:DUF2332 domain-containing protein [Cryobacterium melibiosiphilum]RJT84617.1 DUF2332 domain-containing protein [Cryobacterium melibiosiphilum]